MHGESCDHGASATRRRASMGGRERVGRRAPACPCVLFKRLGVADRRCSLQLAREAKEREAVPRSKGRSLSLFSLREATPSPFIGPSPPHICILQVPFVRRLGSIAQVVDAAISSRLIFGVTTKHLGPGYLGLICSFPTHRLHIPLAFPSFPTTEEGTTIFCVASGIDTCVTRPAPPSGC
jgi:hypothetical protein